MTSVASDVLKPLRRRVARIDKRASRVARQADRALSEVEDRAEDILDSGWSFAKMLHDRIEERPHSAFFAALAIGVVFGFLSRPRS